MERKSGKTKIDYDLFYQEGGGKGWKLEGKNRGEGQGDALSTS